MSPICTWQLNVKDWELGPKTMLQEVELQTHNLLFDCIEAYACMLILFRSVSDSL